MKRIILISLLTLLVSSCCTIKQGSSMQRDTVYVAIHSDTAEKDSVYIFRDHVIKEKGDTIYIKETLVQYRDRWKTREVHDTTYVDKVRVETITKTEEKPLLFLQRFFINFGKVFCVVLLALVGFGGYKLYRKFKG